MKKNDSEKQPDTAEKPEEKTQAAPASETAAAPESKPDEVAALKAEIAALKDSYLRSMADLENYRRRVNREKEELRKFATDALLEEFLPALDNLRLGLVAAKASPEGGNLVSGFGMVADQIMRVLSEHGLKEVDPLGQPFDPNVAEAAAFQPSDTVPAHHVSAVQRTGFLLHDRLLRPALVLVSSGKPA